MKQMKKDRLRKLVLWGYITQPQANQMWRDYLRNPSAISVDKPRNLAGAFIALPTDRK